MTVGPSDGVSVVSRRSCPCGVVCNERACLRNGAEDPLSATG